MNNTSTTNSETNSENNTPKKIKIPKTQKRILNKFIPNKETEIDTTLEEIKTNPTRTETKLLTKATKPKTKIKKLAQQENKYKYLKEYQTEIWAEDKQNQTTKIATINDKNKTLKEIIKQYQETGITEGMSISSTDFYTEILPNIKANRAIVTGKQIGRAHV